MKLNFKPIKKGISIIVIVLLFFNGIGRHDISLKKYYSFSKAEVFNSIGAVYLNNKFSQTCILINSRHLMSSAHGFYIDSKTMVNDTIIVFDKKYPITRPQYTYLADKSSFYFLFNGKKHFANKIVIHPNYNNDFGETGYNDVAIIELSEHIQDITPAMLYLDSNEQGKRGITCGFGDVSKAFGSNLTILNLRRKMAGENMIDSLGGNLVKGKWGIMYADMDNPNSINCNRMGSPSPLPLEWKSDGGDCGSGIFIFTNNNWHLAGISFAPTYYTDIKTYSENYGSYGFIDGWTRVSPIADWIIANTKNE
jgi:hypothetical protein